LNFALLCSSGFATDYRWFNWIVFQRVLQQNNRNFVRKLKVQNKTLKLFWRTYLYPWKTSTHYKMGVIQSLCAEGQNVTAICKVHCFQQLHLDCTCALWLESQQDLVTKAVFPLRQRDCNSIKKKLLYSRLLIERSVRNGASPTSATTMRWRLIYSSYNNNNNRIITKTISGTTGLAYASRRQWSSIA
jgi:hypothetical protein